MSAKSIAIVTGATGGIGAAICHRLNEDGHHIFAHYNHNLHAARQLQIQIVENGGECSLIRADLATNDGIRTIIDSVDEYLSINPTISLDILVNNAAKLLGPSFDEASPDDFDTYFAVNTKAPFFLAQGLSRRMRHRGAIVNISSASAHFSSPGDIVYAMSKSCLESLTRNMAEAVAGEGIRVNAVVPGFTDNGHPAFHDQAALAYMSKFSVLGGVSETRTIAEAVSFLASSKADRSTGMVLDVSGGSTLGARGHGHSSVKDLL